MPPGRNTQNPNDNLVRRNRYRSGEELIPNTPLNSLLAPVAAASLFSAALRYSVKARSSQVFGPSSYRGPGERRSLALTFDDGPSPGTLRILDLLARHGIPATFFQCGVNVLRHPEIAREVACAGHEIGNHTFSHARLCPRLSRRPNLLSPVEILGEFATAQDVIAAETGFHPTLLRAPYGMRWFGLAAAQRRLNLHGVMWTAIGNDWKLPAPEVVSRLATPAAPGAILCLHDGRDIRPDPDISSTLEATRQLLPILMDQGYTFETVSQLLNRAPLEAARPTLQSVS